MAGVISCDSKMRLRNIVDQFPEEMLLNIFGFLDLKSVKNVISVNKRWYDIVTNDTSTMKKLPLKLRGNVLKKNNLIVGDRKFYKVSFDSIDEKYNFQMLSKLEAMGSNVHEIVFSNCRVSEPKVIHDILRNFPNIVSLIFKRCEFIEPYQKSNIEAIQFYYLEDLVLFDSCLMILSFIEAQLVSFRIDMPCFDERTEEAVNNLRLMNFLYTQDRLFTLTLRNNFSLSLIFAKIKMAEYHFKVTNLSLRKSCYKGGYEDGNFKEFLYTQKDSVKVLQLKSPFPNDVHELILSTFENLKTLRIDISNIEFSGDIKAITACKNVKTLFLDGENKNSDNYRAFLSIFPNVTVINFVDDVSCEVLSCLPKCCKALATLALYGSCFEHFQKIEFPALESLHLDTIEFDNGWNDFVMCNRTIESLSFRFFRDNNNFDANKVKTACESLPNLKYLHLAGDMKAKFKQFQNMKESIEIMLSY